MNYVKILIQHYKVHHLKESDLKTLTGGARIANIFRERFPFELVKVITKQKKTLRSFIEKNIYFFVFNRLNYKIKICVIKQ